MSKNKKQKVKINKIFEISYKPYVFSMFISGQIIATCIVIVGYILLIVILAIINAIF